MRIATLFLLLTLTAVPVTAQTAADSAMFDFWVGEWDAWWYGKDSVKEFGRNSITKVLDGAALHEDFSIHSGVNKGFKGRSLSVIDAQSGRWKQTWVDNAGGYIPFTGGAEGTERYFEREFERNGKRVMQKMVFRSIEKERFVWDWTSSTDGGATWNTVWRIHYTRRR